MASALLSILLLAAQSGAAAEPKASPQDLLRQMEELYLKSSPAHPLMSKKKDEQLRAFSKAFRAHGLHAVRPLAWYVGASKRPLKVRLYAAVFLGLLGEPAALPALKARILDPLEDAGLRSTALLSAGSLGLPPAQIRPLLDRCAADSEPEVLRREALAQLSWLGTERVAQAEQAAKRAGPDPEGLALGSAAHAVSALGRAKAAGAEEALLRLLRYYKKGSKLRRRVLSAITRRRLIEKLSDRTLSRIELNTLTDILADERGSAALQAARLLGALRDERSTPALVQTAASAADPALLAELAETLAAIGSPPAVQALQTLSSGLVSDPRFAARDDGPDTRAYALRVQNAAQTAGIAVTIAAEPTTPAEPVAAQPPKKKRRPRLVAAEKTTLPFLYAGWPGNGKPKLAWNGTADKLRLSPQPDRAAPATVAAALEPGAPIAFDDSVVITRAPGLVRANKKVVLEARAFGVMVSVSQPRYEQPPAAVPLEFLEGDQLEVLSYRADGLCFVRRDYNVYLAPCPQHDRARFTILREPDTEWWLHLRTPHYAGWFFAEQEGIDFLPRW
ncbi:MAG: HEAT repeat domain-containing protein [Elusimicrobiota bacterium]